MSAPAPSPAPSPTARRRRVFAALLAGALAAAYARTLGVPFLLDDESSIVTNASLHSWSTAWFPPAGGGETVGGRPLLNLSFALNHALGGLHPAGYHAVNLLIHAATAWLLFGLVRRMLRLAGGPASGAADACAAAVAALWGLHPLATAAVTYVAQRAESLAACWVVLTLHAFLRHAAPLPGERPRPRTWAALAVVACWAGPRRHEPAAFAGRSAPLQPQRALTADEATPGRSAPSGAASGRAGITSGYLRRYWICAQDSGRYPRDHGPSN